MKGKPRAGRYETTTFISFMASACSLYTQEEFGLTYFTHHKAKRTVWVGLAFPSLRQTTGSGARLLKLGSTT